MTAPTRPRLRERAAERARRLDRAAVHVVPFAVVALIVVEWNGIAGQDRDTAAYHHAAAAARVDGQIYEPAPPPGPHEFHGEWPYLYPPPLAALLSWLPDTSYRGFDRGWLLLNLVAFWVAAAALGRIANGRWSAAATGRWGAALFFLPGAVLAIHFGNIDLVILALVALGLALPASAGFSLGLAAAFKVTPVWPLLALALRRPRRTLPGLAAAVALLGGACLLVFGWGGSVALSAQWVTDVMPAVSQGQFWGESLDRLRAGSLSPVHYLYNLSPSFLPVQLAVLSGAWDYEGGPLPGPVRAYLAAVAIGAPLAAAWLTRRRSPEVQAAIVLAAALLAAPIVRPYVLSVVLLVMAALRQERLHPSSLILHPSGAPARSRPSAPGRPA
jgi:hypothetical protein